MEPQQPAALSCLVGGGAAKAALAATAASGSGSAAHAHTGGAPEATCRPPAMWAARAAHRLRGGRTIREGDTTRTNTYVLVKC
jgi:hypothetical protein